MSRCDSSAQNSAGYADMHALEAGSRAKSPSELRLGRRGTLHTCTAAQLRYQLWPLFQIDVLWTGGLLQMSAYKFSHDVVLLQHGFGHASTDTLDLLALFIPHAVQAILPAIQRSPTPSLAPEGEWQYAHSMICTR